MNKILEMIIEKRNGIYVHALEVSDVYELQSCIDSLYDELIEEYDLETFIDFITTLELYCTDEANEEEVYDFNITDYINSL